MRVSLLFLTVLMLASILPGQGVAPDRAAARMLVPAGFEVQLVASEPQVRQPVAIDFDDRGRLWVMQYLQYPNPAGLVRVGVDRYSRTRYHRIPEPPPRGPRGADRLTILLPRSDGTAGPVQKIRDFITGLNLASGFAFGHGGVFVLQVPYLLFYPDRDGDDVPDGDPEVLLTGFGMEDAHSVANSLTWGPDGWLYGCQGSTVTSSIRGIEFQQGVWRYHPITCRFELFCEGGGNSWGLDFDRMGNLLYSTNHGGFVTLHGVQGGYYWKAFGKHGPLHNPYTYGFFDHVPHERFQGGHVSVGGIVYRGAAFPSSFRERLIAADLLGHNVYWHELSSVGSTFRTRHGGELLVSRDTWFAPCDIVAGPDGAVYVADWHDQRTAHPDPDAEWDRTNGRIYRIAPRGTPAYRGVDLTKLPSSRLLALLEEPEDWLVRRARRILADRRDPEVIFPLREQVWIRPHSQGALEALWALYVSGGFSESFALQCLSHPAPAVRAWAIRWIGDSGRATPAQTSRLLSLARSETEAFVLSQLACSARRLPALHGLDIVAGMLESDRDRGDPHIPLLLWWAVEARVETSLARILSDFTAPAVWKSRLASEIIQPRLMRRLAAGGSTSCLEGCTKLLASAPSTEQQSLLAALELGLSERTSAIAAVPAGLRKILVDRWSDDTADPVLLRLLMRLDEDRAHRRALNLTCAATTPAMLRVKLVTALGEVGRPEALPTLLKLVGGKEPVALQQAALEALSRCDLDTIADRLLALYPDLTPALRSRARSLLLARASTARRFVDVVRQGKIDGREVTADELRPLARFRDARLDEQVRRLWGSIQPATAEVKLAEVRRLGNDLRAAPGDSTRGKALFASLCGTCHRLHGEGGILGPDLTHANRRDSAALLVNMVDPSAIIRKEFLSWTIETSDGRIRTGLIVEQTPGQITLADAKNERTTIPRSRILRLEESPVSLMPENLLRDLKPQQLRDLFAYLQGDAR